MAWCIETRGLTRDFDGFRAVDNIAIQAPAGAFYGFLGPNGAGKSTTIKMLTGMLAPTAGSVCILGRDLAREPLAIKARIGVLPEDLCLFDHLTAHEYLGFIGAMYGLPKAVARTRTGELLELLGLADTGKTHAIEFSHGMKKKLALAAAIMHDPELVFLDEPFEGIDAVTSRTIRRVLDRIVARGGSVFLTSHILEIVERLCTHVGIIAKGRLAAQGPLSESRGAHESLEAMFLAAVGEPERNELGLSWLEDKP